MLKVFVGHSEDALATYAVNEVVEQVKSSLAGAQPRAGIVFCSVDFDHAEILSVIRENFPAMALAGCTTDGELSSGIGFAEDSLILMVFVSDKLEICAGVGRDAARRGGAAGREAAATARAGLSRYVKEERFAIILTDPLNAGVSDIDKGIQEVFGRTFPIIGGASAAHSKKRKTFQFYNGEVLTDSVVMLLFAGPVAFSCGIMGGHSPMGPKEPVTKAEDNVLYRIGDQPAVDYFHKYIGNYDLFMNYCLAVYEQDRDSFYVRSAPFSDVDRGTVTLNGRVSKGAMVQIGTADKNSVIRSCNESIRRALEAYPGARPAAALFFSCAGRKMIMGTQIVQELQTVQRHLPDIPFAGFYCYGEFGPLEKGSPYLFHGTTFVTLLLGAAEEDDEG
ncbi:FIST signal transduction protein [Anaeroselena agilis]|uniref:FIST N-terminal domain-containing protein n=1 Tax=Anaeroselena agilis TaxID=3063788 RepID=A0ABU3NZ12_9FIRM|nr:FIST N-terminal domain-containing protein [Selenomonadales bacterium 4137-cl]